MHGTDWTGHRTQSPVHRTTQRDRKNRNDTAPSAHKDPHDRLEQTALHTVAYPAYPTLEEERYLTTRNGVRGGTGPSRERGKPELLGEGE